MAHELGADVEAQLLRYIEQTSDLVGVVDEHSQVRYLNEAARKRLGVSDVEGLTTADLFPSQVFARYYDEIRPALLRFGSWTGDVPVFTASGDLLPVTLTIVAQIGSFGEISGLVTHGREIETHEPAVPAGHFGRDDLTGLPQRSVLDDRIRVALRHAARADQGVGVVLVDIDSMKDINDSFGHAVGDEVLRSLAHRMVTAVRDADTVARCGGDEFGILLDGVSRADDAIPLAERVRDAIGRTSLDTSVGDLVVSASIGVAIGGADDRPDELLTRADAAMYQAKADGAGQIVVFDGDAALSISTITDEFAIAVSHGLIRPHVQPIIDLRTNDLIGYQGLARWEHPERGLLAAGDFINIVANTPMASVVDLAVLRRTAAVAARVARRGATVRAYGHLSRRLIGDVGIEQFLVQIANDLALTNSSLCCEIAYPVVARRSRVIHAALRALHELGIRIVLSDVHGECDVNSIVEHAFDEVRLSPRLVHEATVSQERRRVLEGTVALAHALELPVIAVGIETEGEQVTMLDAGCDFGQGYLFGRPIPAGSVE